MKQCADANFAGICEHINSILCHKHLHFQQVLQALAASVTNTFSKCHKRLQQVSQALAASATNACRRCIQCDKRLQHVDPDSSTADCFPRHCQHPAIKIYYFKKLQK